MAGTVTISIEVELGWGVHDLTESDHLTDDGRAERDYLRRLLDRCDEVGVPISFDVVGHLLLDSCDGRHGGPHRPGWFDADPGTDAETDPLFYAPDAASDVRGRDADHELCTHTFSHVLCDRVDDETLAWELDRVQRLHRRRLGRGTVSFVPPRHFVPDHRTLRDAGIEVVRLGRADDAPTPLHKARELLLGPHPVHEPRLVDGLVETYCTTYPSLTAASLPAGQQPTHPAFRALPVGLRRRLHRRYLRRAVDRAVASDSHCHLWCHLFDLANDHQWSPLRAFLGDLADRRDRGEVEVLTMARLNDRVRERGDGSDRRDGSDRSKQSGRSDPSERPEVTDAA